MRLRPLTPADAAEVLRINAASAPNVARLDATELARLLGIDNMHLASVRPDGSLAGYLLAFHSSAPYDGEEFGVFHPLLARPFVYIDQVAVDASERGRGVGRAFYAETADFAFMQGAGTVCCEVNLSPPNPESLAYHQRLGFETLREMDTRDGRRVVLLHRKSR